MKWLLVMVVLHLSGEQSFVKHAEVLAVFDNEKACMAAGEQRFKDADKEGNPIPPSVSMGCMPDTPAPDKPKDYSGAI